ncbi:MAG TPA: enoyl-CoA hydratase-related protein, partial [Quisquiliibacterium sp.]|nr:enoyl-CoA hydratase-related protein [Quisquiliibacterium sp.]
ALTLNRPGALNAFNDALYGAFARALTEAAASPDVAAVIVTGEGRAFSAGQDLAELGDSRSHDERQQAGFGPFIAALESFPKPLIAAVNGLGVGIGMTMLPHCDLVLVSETARLRVPFASLGVTAEAGSSLLLAQRMGWQAAAHALFTGRWIDADEAVRQGLAYRKLAAARLLDEAHAIAAEIAAMPVASLVATKRLMLDARLEASRAARAREDLAFAALVGGPANREALAAFAERRTPDFSRL